MRMEGVYKLYFGESNLPTPAFIKEAAQQAMAAVPQRLLESRAIIAPMHEPPDALIAGILSGEGSAKLRKMLANYAPSNVDGRFSRKETMAAQIISGSARARPRL
jgi:hypothetical protein